jgi:serine/threonine-protein kinase
MIKDNTAYVIIYDAELANYSKYVAVAVKMLDSFEINIVEEVMEPAELVVYESSTYGVKIKHPSDWVAVEPEDKYIKAAFYSPFEGDSDLYAENIMILIETLPFNMKLADYTNLSINNMKKSVSDLEIIESGASALAGYAAHRIVFTFTIVDYEDINAKGMALWTIKDKKAYMIMYGAESGSYDKYLQTAQAMIDSFEIGH